jgi:Zn-dependent peptidase ImmA (M78 family)
MFNPSRLKLARERRGFTKVALAEEVGLTPRRISSYENQGDPPPPSTIEQLAAALCFPTAFFEKTEPAIVEPDSVSFRSLTRLSARSRDMALAAASLAREVATWMDQRFDLPEVDVPDLRDVGPREAAAAVRAEWSIGELPAPNMIHLLEAHGVRVFSLVDECASLDALSMWIEEMPFVFLTSHKSPERARWDAAHELGHIVLHGGVPPHGREHERQADEFASEMLMPERGVMARTPRFADLGMVRQEKIFWRVSALAFIRRLHDLRVVTDWQYKSLVIEASQAGYRRREGDIERETSQLIPKVLDVMKSEGVSIADIASDLSIVSSELRGLLFSPLNIVQSGGPSAPSPSSGQPVLRVVDE